MVLNVCKHCRKQFYSKIQKFACKECEQVDNMRFAQIKAYLKSYPNSNAVQIAEALSIPSFTVLKYIDEGKLQLGKGSFEQI